jgi:hypothetical protein
MDNNYARGHFYAALALSAEPQSGSGLKQRGSDPDVARPRLRDGQSETQINLSPQTYIVYSVPRESLAHSFLNTGRYLVQHFVVPLQVSTFVLPREQGKTTVVMAPSRVIFDTDPGRCSKQIRGVLIVCLP